MEQIVDKIYKLFGGLGYDVAEGNNIITVLDANTGESWTVTVK